jgi:hypothetical protein
MSELTFIIGTGRAASTMLTRAFHQHPEILSLNELCTSVGPKAFPSRDIDGSEFWRLLSRPRPGFDAAIRSGAVAPEILYPRLPDGRFRAETGIPAICLTVLPALTEKPDQLFDELAGEVPHWPTRTPRAQWMALFSWLCDRFERRIVVERSGFSLRFLPVLQATFPDARFVHLYRHGPDCALSMSRHAGFRMISLLLEMCAIVGVETIEDLRPAHAALLPPDLAPLLGERYDPALVLDRPMPPARFGRLWSDSVVRGVHDLRAVPPAQRADLHYERLLATPCEELHRLTRLLGVTAHPGWLAHASAACDPTRRGSVEQLPPATKAELVDACRPGMRALGLEI